MYYFIGINQPGMLSLALFLKEMGHQVSCSEINNQVKKEFEISPTAKVIKGENVATDNPELLKAKKLNLKIISYHEMINILLEKHQTILVLEDQQFFLSKLLAEVIDQLAGCNCLIIDQTIKANLKNKYLILNIGLDNCQNKINNSYYTILSEKTRDLKNLIIEYKDCLNKTKKIILAYGDYLNNDLDSIKKPIFLYGLNKKNDIIVKNLLQSKDGYVFDIFVEENYYGHFDLVLKNKEQLIDVMAIITICYYERFSAKDLSNVLKKTIKMFN